MAVGRFTFGAVGDIAFHGGATTAIREHGMSWPFARVKAYLDQADLLFGNMESVLLPPDYPVEAIDPAGLLGQFSAVQALKEAGFDFVNLAQNHILDGGEVGLFHTRDAIEAVGVATGGVGATQAEARTMRVLRCNGLSVGFLCYGEDSNYTLGTRGPCHAYYDPQTVIDDVRANRAAVDVLVVSIHADLEFMSTPSWPRRQEMRAIAAAGATLVLGHHPHVSQGIERIGNSLVAYSLGNFFFPAHSNGYMKAHAPETAETYLLLAEVSRDGVGDFRRVPCHINEPPDERPVPMEGAAAEAMLRRLAVLDRMVLDDVAVRRLWREQAQVLFREYLQELKDADESQALTTLGRLLLVRENRQWTSEILELVKENWARRTAGVDPLHRPHYLLTRPNA